MACAYCSGDTCQGGSVCGGSRPQTRELISLESIIGLSEQFFEATAGITTEMHLPPFMHALAAATMAEIAHRNLLKMAKTEEEVEEYLRARDLVLASIPRVP
jgi:hypothetical protein